MAAKPDKPKAITAMAHKVDAGQDYYEQRYRERVVRNLEQWAKALGFELVSVAPEGVAT